MKRAALKKKEYKPTKVYWFFGPTGTGKSRRVKEIINEKVINKVIKKDEVTINYMKLRK